MTSPVRLRLIAESGSDPGHLVDPPKDLAETHLYKSCGFFVLRTPLLPIDELLKLSEIGAYADLHTATRAQLHCWVRRERRRIETPESAHKEANPAPVETLSAPIINPDLASESEWLFAKLYCSPSHADRLLLELVQPLVAAAVSAGTADRWFFLRYGDPRWHLRVRFHGSPAALSHHVLPDLRRRAEPFQRQGILGRLELDRYEPEVERYGGPLGIAIAERIFQFDSELCLDLLPLFLSNAGAELRWQVAFCGADRLLAGLGLPTAEKRELADQLRATREEAWTVDATYRKQLARKFRSGQMRQTLAALLNEFDGDLNHNRAYVLPSQAVSRLQGFSDRLQIIRAEWERLAQAGELRVPLSKLAPSLVHMYLNRMLRSRHHEQEAVLCDFLVRTYAALLARDETR